MRSSIHWPSNRQCIAKNGGGYTQRGVAKGLNLWYCLFMIAEVSIRCPKTPEVGIGYAVYPRIPPNTPLPPINSRTGSQHLCEWRIHCHCRFFSGRVWYALLAHPSCTNRSLCFLFFNDFCQTMTFRTDFTDSPDCLPILLSISVFTL